MTSKTPTLADLVREWVKTKPHFKGHIAISEAWPADPGTAGRSTGFFVDMACSDGDPSLSSVAFVGQTEPNSNYWAGNLDPHEPDFFKKLERLIRLQHNGLKKDFGCDTDI